MEMEASRTAGRWPTSWRSEGEKVPVGATIAVLATRKENPADVKKQFAGGGKAASRRRPP